MRLHLRLQNRYLARIRSPWGTKFPRHVSRLDYQVRLVHLSNPL